MIAKAARKASAFDTSLLVRAVGDAFVKLDPRKLARNPVIFVTEIVTVLVTILAIRDAFTGGPVWFSGQIALWLWFTVLFATFAEAVAEGRGKAQADALRRTRTQAHSQAPQRSEEPHALRQGRRQRAEGRRHRPRRSRRY